MKRVAATTSALVLLFAAGAASAQTPISPGQTASGQLTSSDPTLDDDSHYDCFTLQTRAGSRYRIDLTSEDFDAYLAVGGDGCQMGADESDDDSAGGTNSRLDVAGGGRRLYIRANSLGSGQTGRYQLSVVEMGGASAGGSSKQSARGSASIDWNATVPGDLSSSDAKASDDSFYDCYAFAGQQGQRAVIDLRSEAFDAYASLHSGNACDGEALETDDDGAGGTDARIEIALPRSGPYSIRANSLTASETGAYQLSLSEARATKGGLASTAPSANDTLANARETDACVYRRGSRVMEQARGRTDGRQTLVKLDGREIPWSEGGFTQADGRDWYRDARAVEIGGSRYTKYGLPRVLGFREVAYYAEHDGVLFAAETVVDNAQAGLAAFGVSSKVRPEVVYALVRSVGCEFQPYQLDS